MKASKIFFIVLIIYLLAGSIYFVRQYDDYRHMKQIASMEQVDWDLDKVPFWNQQKNAVDIFILVSILLSLGIAGAHAGEKKIKKINKEKWHPRITLPGPEIIQSLKGNKVWR